MSGYLTRLATRGRETGEMQSMQPFVRSTSPIAEHDRRTGMMGFEGFELGEATSFAEVGSEPGVERGDILESPAPPSAMTDGETRIATVQRQVASPLAGMAGSAAPTATPGSRGANAGPRSAAGASGSSRRSAIITYRAKCV
jgi:hypothetical protein